MHLSDLLSQAFASFLQPDKNTAKQLRSKGRVVIDRNVSRKSPKIIDTSTHKCIIDDTKTVASAFYTNQSHRLQAIADRLRVIGRGAADFKQVCKLFRQVFVSFV